MIEIKTRTTLKDMTSDLSTLLFLESELKKRKTLSSKTDLISNHNKFSDIKEIINFLPEEYIAPLINGVELEIKEELREARRKHKVEIHRMENKSLDELIKINSH